MTNRNVMLVYCFVRVSITFAAFVSWNIPVPPDTILSMGKLYD